MRNEGHEYGERLGPTARRRTVLEYLSTRYPHATESTWRRRIEAGEVVIDGRSVGPDSELEPGRTLAWRRPPWDEPEPEGEIELIHRDDEHAVIAKPAGLPTLPGAGYHRATVLHRARQLIPGATPVHRLGRWTSGIVMLALGPRARADLARQFADRSITKRYRALASGDPVADRMELVTPIGPVPHPRLGSVHAACDGGKPSRSIVTVVERRAASFLCDVEIVTGRPHQVRIHLAAAGHPLVGDPLYPPGGRPASDCDALPGDPGYRLHAAEVRYRCPTTGAATIVSCPPPAASGLDPRDRSRR